MLVAILLLVALVGCSSAAAPAGQPSTAAAGPAAAPPSAPAGTGWEAAWNALIEAARREGTVVVKGPPTQRVRVELPAAFEARFGVKLEYIAGPTGPYVEKLKLERQAGVYSTDVFLAGADTMYTAVYPEKMLDPIPPVLIHPDARDASQWPGGKLWFMDPEGQYILRLNNYLTSMIQLNTQYIRPEAITSWYDLLKPEYKGKIASFDPAVSGSGISTAAYLYHALGEEYIKRLFVDQEPVFSRDERQLGDWLARGTYPIVLSLTEAEMNALRRDGLPVINLPHPPEAPGHVTAGFGLLGLVNNAPHPNAAKLFVNWIVTKEGMEIWSKAENIVPVRLDIDKAAWRPELVPRPDQHYFDTYSWEFVTETRAAVMQRLRELLRR
jgi:iron(III) transport system substrate-binding protein